MRQMNWISSRSLTVSKSERSAVGLSCAGHAQRRWGAWLTTPHCVFLGSAVQAWPRCSPLKPTVVLWPVQTVKWGRVWDVRGVSAVGLVSALAGISLEQVWRAVLLSSGSHTFHTRYHSLRNTIKVTKSVLQKNIKLFSTEFLPSLNVHFQNQLPLIYN